MISLAIYLRLSVQNLFQSLLDSTFLLYDVYSSFKPKLS